MGTDPRPKVVYIAGWGRSGSTLLARLLGEIDGFVAVGELNLISRPNWARWQCACGSVTSSCEFWTRVLATAYGDGWPAALRDLHERHRAVVRHRNLRALLRSKRSGDMEDQLREFGRTAAALYRSILDVSGARVVVDESKLGVEAIALAASGAVDIRVVHLVRDPRAVAYSWQRHRPRVHGQAGELRRYGAVRGTLEWDVRNLAAEQARKVAPYLLVRYEELTADPAATLARIADLAGESAILDFLDGAVASLGPNHAFAGNPMLGSSGRVDIRNDAEWRDAMPRVRRMLVGALAGPVHRRYRGTTAAHR
jgi:hypothetical protein